MSSDNGLKPLALALKLHRRQMKGATVYDKIVGLASARLLVLAKVKEINTELASQSAVAYLEKNNIKITAEETIPRLLNQAQTSQCEMEKLALEFKDNQKFYRRLLKVLKI